MTLFAQTEQSNRRRAEPLAVRMRPQTLDDFAGQEHFLGEGKLLRRLITADRLGSVIFHGPPGTGKTTLAYILADSSKSAFRELSAVSDGVKTLRDILTEAYHRLSVNGQKTLLFVDEIHRFNKAQQDVLLPEVENGVVILVGATTENPYFTLNNALLSRSRLFQFVPLTAEHIKTLLLRAAADKEYGLGYYNINLHDDAIEYLASVCDGDARQALSALEIGVLSSKNTTVIEFTKQLAAESVQKKIVSYDRSGDSHYDTISALIKSIRGSDPDAAIYWLAKMLTGGDDVRFLARRLVILSSEDIGNADPAALPLAVATAHACELAGLPECQLNLAQCVIYLALAPKSNTATTAIYEAMADVEQKALIPVPKNLKNIVSTGDGTAPVDYKYAHEFEDGIVAQEYLGIDKEYYRPTNRGFEVELTKRLAFIKERLAPHL